MYPGSGCQARPQAVTQPNLHPQPLHSCQFVASLTSHSREQEALPAQPQSSQGWRGFTSRIALRRQNQLGVEKGVAHLWGSHFSYTKVF